MSRTTKHGEASGSRKKRIDKLSVRSDKQIYLEKLKLKQLMNGTNLEYLKKVKELEDKHQERLTINQIWRENSIKVVEELYKKDEKDAADEFVLKMELLVNSTGESTNKSHQKESPDKHQPQEKHAVNDLLNKEEIENDLQGIETGVILPLPIEIDGLNIEPRPEMKIENKKLLYNKSWYCRGQSVFVSGENLPEFPAVIFSIGNETVTFKNINNGMNLKVSLKLLLYSQIQIKRRHS